MPNKLTTDERLGRIDAQLDRIATAVVKGFVRIDKALETKADKADLDRWVHEVAKKIGYELTA